MHYHVESPTQPSKISKMAKPKYYPACCCFDYDLAFTESFELEGLSWPGPAAQSPPSRGGSGCGPPAGPSERPATFKACLCARGRPQDHLPATWRTEKMNARIFRGVAEANSSVCKRLEESDQRATAVDGLVVLLPDAF